MATQFLSLAQGKLAYDDSGSGPLVLCIPGMGDVRQEYRLLTPRLVAEGYRVVTLDVRGHGETSVDWPDYSVRGIADDISALLEHLHVGSAVIVGNSMAAGAVLIVAHERPQQVAGAILIGPVVRDFPGNPLMPLMYNVLFRAPWGASAWVQYYTTLFPSRRPDDFADFSAHLRSMLAEPGRLRALRRMILASKSASAAVLNAITVPVQIVMGTKDPDFPNATDEARYLADTLHGDVVLVEGAGHYPQTERPDIVTDPILTFLSLHLRATR